MGFIRGITLDDHPLRLPESLLTGAVRGSAGIPDSLVHKPVDTSGRAAWSTCRLLWSGCLFFLSRLNDLFHCSLFVDAVSCVLCRHSRPRLSADGRVADLRKSIAGTVGNCGRMGSGLPEIAAVRPCGKSLENGRLFLLRVARRRVIIELSPGKPETTRIAHPARAMSTCRRTPHPKGNTDHDHANPHHRHQPDHGDPERARDRFWAVAQR